MLASRPAAIGSALWSVKSSTTMSARPRGGVTTYKHDITL